MTQRNMNVFDRWFADIYSRFYLCETRPLQIKNCMFEGDLASVKYQCDFV